MSGASCLAASSCKELVKVESASSQFVQSLRLGKREAPTVSDEFRLPFSSLIPVDIRALSRSRKCRFRSWFQSSRVHHRREVGVHFRRSKSWGSGPGQLNISASAGVKEVQFAPPDFDFRAETIDDTLALVGSTYPELMDLVEDGTLVVVQREKDYVERRSDGYVEPEMVFVVGTAHMSLLSAAHVERIVQSVRPENVVVELCRSRAGIMYDDVSTAKNPSNDGAISQPDQKEMNLMSLSGENFGSAMSRSLSLGGRSALALRLLLGFLSQNISKSAGVAIGEEFRAARKSANLIGAQLVLGDRPIEVTASNSKFDISEEVLQVLKSDDALSAMFSEMGSQLPSLLQPLIYERDMYLAWSLKRSKAVNGSSRVVGVMGRGHMRGVVYNLKYNQENLRFKDLVGTRDSAKDKSSKVKKFATNILVETTIGGILWLIYELVSGKGL